MPTVYDPETQCLVQTKRPRNILTARQRELQAQGWKIYVKDGNYIASRGDHRFVGPRAYVLARAAEAGRTEGVS